MVNVHDIPGYEILGKIGISDIATVYRARHIRHDHDIALKVIPLHQDTDLSFRKQFISEVRKVAKLDHPNIVKIHDVGIYDDHIFIAKELLEGGNLNKRLIQGVEVNTAAQIVYDITKALDYIHDLHYIHRNIKLENILFRADGSAVLSDFDIAMALDSLTSMTVSVGVGRKPSYIGPEQAKGEALDGRADLYSVGVFFFEMVTGEFPFKPCSASGAISKQINELNSQAHGSLAYLQPFFDITLAYNPVDRFATGKEMARYLRDILDSGVNASQLPQSMIQGRKRAWNRNPKVPTLPRQSKISEPLISEPLVDAKLHDLVSTAPNSPSSRPKLFAAVLTLILIVGFASSLGVFYRFVPDFQRNAGGDNSQYNVAARMLKEHVVLNADEVETAFSEQNAMTVKLHKADDVTSNSSGIDSEVKLYKEAKVKQQVNLNEQQIQNAKTLLNSADKASKENKIDLALISYRKVSDQDFKSIQATKSLKAISKKRKLAKTLSVKKATPSKANPVNPADKTQTIPKSTKVVVKVKIEQVAPQLLHDFKDSLETRNKSKLDTLSMLSTRKLKFTKMLFDDYKKIRLDVRSFGTSNNNYAMAELEIVELIDKRGKKEKPSDAWKIIAIQIKANESGKALVYWQ